MIDANAQNAIKELEEILHQFGIPSWHLFSQGTYFTAQ
jgi:hypothetical protein